MKMAKKQNQPLVSSASVVDGKLILSLPDAYTPVVWQMDLEQARSSALEVREDSKSSRFILSLKTQNSEITDIASYEERSSAVQALMATSRALENAHGSIRPQTLRPANHNTSGSGNQTYSNNPSAAIGNENKGGRAGAFLAAAMLVVLVLAWTFSLSKPMDSGFKTSRSSSDIPSESGVPVSADDFLSQR